MDKISAMQKNDPLTLLLSQGLFVLNAVIWVAFGVTSLVQMGNNPNIPVITLGVIAVLMFFNAAFMLLAGWGLGRRQKRYWYFALALLAVNIVLTFTDQFGFFDLVTLLIDAALFVLLVMIRKHYAVF
jgi:lysylphosphatidylglycerol synthetase-like protein (DUF2156 family)